MHERPVNTTGINLLSFCSFCMFSGTPDHRGNGHINACTACRLNWFLVVVNHEVTWAWDLCSCPLLILLEVYISSYYYSFNVQKNRLWFPGYFSSFSFFFPFPVVFCILLWSVDIIVKSHLQAKYGSITVLETNAYPRLFFVM